MNLSIVILCWNDDQVISDCLRSIESQECDFEFEVIVVDNNSTDHTVSTVRRKYPSVKVVCNSANKGFALGNNDGIRLAQGKFILILNPDTVLHTGMLQSFIDFANVHPDGGAFGCRVLNPDGSYQLSARPLPSIAGLISSSLGLRTLAKLLFDVESDQYLKWYGDCVKDIGYQYGCCLLFRGDLLRRLRGFDKQFFYHYEEVDLCKRVWDSGNRIIYDPKTVITHLGAPRRGKFPVKFAIETYRGRYRYFAKHHGARSARQLRFVVLVSLLLRLVSRGVARCLSANPEKLHLYESTKLLLKWNFQLSVDRFLEYDEEPNIGVERMRPPGI